MGHRGGAWAGPSSGSTASEDAFEGQQSSLLATAIEEGMETNTALVPVVEEPTKGLMPAIDSWTSVSTFGWNEAHGPMCDDNRWPAQDQEWPLWIDPRLLSGTGIVEVPLEQSAFYGRVEQAVF